MALKSRTSSILMPIQGYFVYGDGSGSGWGERERLKGLIAISNAKKRAISLSVMGKVA